MKIHRFIGSYDFGADRLTIKDSDTIHQINNVLKLKRNEEIFLCDGHMNDALCTITEVGKKGVDVKVVEKLKNTAESPVDAEIYCAILKRENFELVVQKATEVGISKVIPIITARTIKTDIKHERLAKIAQEAAELSGRGRIPEIADPIKLATAIEKAEEERLNIFFDATGRDLKSVTELTTATHVAGWVGPEGGWTDEERNLALGAGFKLAGLGPQMLRGETAAIIVSYIICHR
ncbi:16S rRNA (uracil(1498)-N(3))-methyltransferase [Candidatus Uhrbacteria bacterium]|nr:16S rRNA (uracil(1498)-N(3))-methyltransferase [Candidatus Uhrbacteria bacterium]